MLAYVWLIVAVLLLVVEGLSYALVSIWFALGALLTMIAAMCGISDIYLQMTIFVLSSGVFLLLSRTIFKKYLKGKTIKTNADSIVGMVGIVREKIDNLVPSGLVKVSGQDWTARSEGNAPIDEGSRVKVLRIEGVKLIVEKISE